MGNSNPKLDLVEAKGWVVSTPRYLKYLGTLRYLMMQLLPATLMYLTSNLLNCEDEKLQTFKRYKMYKTPLQRYKRYEMYKIYKIYKRQIDKITTSLLP